VLDTLSVTPATATPTPGTDQAINGDFEHGAFGTIGTVSGWNVAGSVADHTEGATTGTHSAVFTAASDSVGDQLWQNFSTTPGQRYVVDFDAGIYGKRSGAPLQSRVQVQSARLLLDDTITPRGLRQPSNTRRMMPLKPLASSPPRVIVYDNEDLVHCASL
jgi:hypothetical protein